MSGPVVSGQVEPGFGPVADAFRENFAKRGEVGAGLCVTAGGRVVVDLWGGLADRDTGRAWEADTINVLFSATKGLTATAFLVLEDRGGIDLDATAASLWPEIGAVSKTIRVRDVLNHRLGLVGFHTPVTLADLTSGRALEVLLGEKPSWEPGTAQGYHGITFGPLAGELFRRASGRTVGTFLRDEVTGPLGADVHVPLPESEEHRVARLYPQKRRTFLTKALPQILVKGSHEGRTFRSFLGRGDTRRAFGQPAELGARGIRNYDSRAVRANELLFASGVGSARGLARFYAPLANGGSVDGFRLVSAAAIDRVKPRQTWSERDRVMQKPLGFSQGFIKEGGEVFSPNPEAFGHPGAGGSLGWADPVAGVSIGYVMNQMDWRIRSPRALELCHALYRCL